MKVDVDVEHGVRDGWSVNQRWLLRRLLLLEVSHAPAPLGHECHTRLNSETPMYHRGLPKSLFTLEQCESPRAPRQGRAAATSSQRPTSSSISRLSVLFPLLNLTYPTSSRAQRNQVCHTNTSTTAAPL